MRMAKNLNRFFCKECGYETIKWLGQCPSCKSWNTMVEAPKESKETSRAFSRTSGGARAEIKKLKEYYHNLKIKNWNKGYIFKSLSRNILSKNIDRNLTIQSFNRYLKEAQRR